MSAIRNVVSTDVVMRKPDVLCCIHRTLTNTLFSVVQLGSLATPRLTSVTERYDSLMLFGDIGSYRRYENLHLLRLLLDGHGVIPYDSILIWS